LGLLFIVDFYGLAGGEYVAQFTVNTTAEEQEKVLNAIKELNGATAPVSTIASMTGLRHSRVRYAIQDLVDAKRIEKIPTKAFNKHYVRYCYRIL
jgi:predicted HTH transcriptional regulator